MTAPAAGAPFPLSEEAAAQLQALVADLDAAALTWLSGYAAGLAAERARTGGRAAVAVAAPGAGREAGPTATVLYASQTGNGRRIAERLGRELQAAGVAAHVVAAGDYPLKKLADERLAYFIASTHGDGEPPDDARALFDFLTGRRAPKLEHLSYAVLALGDSSYPQFCATGRILDERLAALGARRLAPRVDCDVDFEPATAPWLESAVALARTETGAGAPRLAVVTPLRASAPALAGRDQPLEVELITNQRITARDADRDVRHLELALPPQRFDYEAGDALGVWVENAEDAVGRVLELTRLDGAAAVTVDGHTHALRAWLQSKREVTRVAKGLVEQLAARTGNAELAAWLAPGGGESLRRAFKELQVADLLKRAPSDWEPEALVRALQPMTPRLYSIASSRREVGDEAHLTVAVLDYLYDGERRRGAASWQLAAQSPGAKLRAYIEPNTRFRLPADGARDVIMIGPGTGVAPFRGFLQQRVADEARGRNWLVYGGRRRERDFLYQLEWQDALKRGRLHRLDVAFSRDQQHKYYVQHSLLERGAELWAWLEGGAHLYVCGDAERMAPDVHAALLAIVARHGGRSEDDAREYLNDLTAAKRYARDVY